MSESISTLQFATKILNDIQNKSLDPETLSTEQRRICVRFMVHDRKFTKIEIAEILHVSRQCIWEDQRALERTQIGAALMVDELETIREYMVTAETAMARLFRKGKEKDAFDIYDKYIERMQSLGYVKRVAQEHNFKGQISLLEVLKFEQSFHPKHESGNNGNASGNGNGRDQESSSRLEESPL